MSPAAAISAWPKSFLLIADLSNTRARPPPSHAGWQFPQRSPGWPESAGPPSAPPASSAPASGVPASPGGGGGAMTPGYVTNPPANVALTDTPFSVTAEAPGAYAWKSRTGLPVTDRVAPASFASIAPALDR